MRRWVADFETTTTKRKDYDGTCHVWAVGLCEVGNPDDVTIMTTMDEFMDWCQDINHNYMVYFHNIRFDGNFIIQWLFKHGFEHITDKKSRKDKTFKTIISEKGLWYEIEIFFKAGKKVNKVVFRDSYKLIPLSVEEIAKEFRLPFQKGSIDYSSHDFLPEGSELTEEEKEYLINDVRIVEHALNFFISNGLTKMTIGACAMSEFKGIIGDSMFKTYFPTPFYDAEVREAYRGAWNYLAPQFRNKKIKKNMIVLDVNSLYSSVMGGCDGEIVPCGNPIYYEGKYEPDGMYNVYIQSISCSFRLKPNKVPTITVTNDWYFQGGNSSHITTSDGEEVVLHLTSTDLELFLEQYDVFNIEYLHGWKFIGVPAGDVFGKYVMRWSNIKAKAKEDGNWGMYLIAKLFLNTLYGKFGSATRMVNRIPYMDDGKLRFKDGEAEEKDGVYIAMACFITAYARKKTIKAAQTIIDNYVAGKSKIQFVYADTDSLHCISPGFKLPEGLNIHKTELGAWDHEADAVQAKFIRQKCYIEKHIITQKIYEAAMKDDSEIKECYSIEDGKYYYTKITVAGMPDTCYKHVTFDNFNVGTSYSGKLSYELVDGGVVLEEIDFTIQK